MLESVLTETVNTGITMGQFFTLYHYISNAGGSAGCGSYIQEPVFQKLYSYSGPAACYGSRP